jgi:hypothetical protein
MPLMRRTFPNQPPFRVLELPALKPALDAATMGV